jgi:hypothetical protein
MSSIEHRSLTFVVYSEGLPPGAPIQWESHTHGWVGSRPAGYPADTREVTVGFLTRGWNAHPEAATVLVDHTRSPELVAISLEAEPWANEALQCLCSD